MSYEILIPWHALFKRFWRYKKCEAREDGRADGEQTTEAKHNIPHKLFLC